LNGIYEVFITAISIFIVLWQNLNVEFLTLKKLNLVIDVFKNFLFSDNYLSFNSMVLTHLFKSIALTALNFLTLLLSFVGTAIHFVVGPAFFDLLTANLNLIWSYLIISFYDILILLLQWFMNIHNLYFSEVSIFGFFSTWYEHLNSGVQKGNSKNSLINWMLLHIYLSIIVFWVLDFDFRVSAKSPPKTPYTLLEEAKRTYDWIPANMDFGSMQTNHTSIYFALLDISFEHVESLQFVYGDFEYIDEEFDHEDDTPDEEEFWNDIQETTTVRDIIDKDIFFGKTVPSYKSYYNPINAKTSYERHYLTEIVGEPELTFIESELKWMYESIYSPSFEELHFKDSLFSEWVFDPDEDLTLFEVLIFFPLFFYFIYVWFYHRRKRKHYKGWLRFMIPTRRTAYSGSYMEDLLGVSLGNYGKKMFDAMRKYKAPELRVKNFYRLKLQRNNQRLKLLQVESFFFEKLRHKAYKKALKEWEKGLNIGVEFLVPRKRLPQYYTGIKNLKIEMKTWAKLGDWIKFDRFSGEYKYKGGFRRYEHYQYDLPALLDMYMMKVARIRKRKRYLWRTINKLPGQNYTASRSKFWHSRFSNTEFFFPSHKMKYNYNYYNYIGWRDNRTHWRRYAFTPGNVTNKIWALNRDVPEGGYRSFRGHQKKRRLMKSFQF
jgi:hypothetical protein